MKIPGILPFIVAIMLLPLAAFASKSGPKPGVVITGADNGKQITLSKGQTFEVRLEQSGGTGYLWRIVHPDKTRLEVLESSRTALKDGRIVGGPLLMTWKIKAIKTGHTGLLLLLYRPWEGTKKAADSFRVKIKIK